jgi:hypothetical protein
MAGVIATEIEAKEVPAASDSRPARKPLGPAPARFGAAGISAGEGLRYKTTVPRFAEPSRTITPVKIARGLGWFSIGLGVAELVAARPLSRWLGIESRCNLIRAYGAREVATGALILASSSPGVVGQGVKARVVGDVVDLATLAHGLNRRNRKRRNVEIALGLVAGITLADVLCSALLCDR